jgi:hypothetical protein
MPRWKRAAAALSTNLLWLRYIRLCKFINSWWMLRVASFSEMPITIKGLH